MEDIFLSFAKGGKKGIIKLLIDQQMKNPKPKNKKIIIDFIYLSIILILFILGDNKKKIFLCLKE